MKMYKSTKKKMANQRLRRMKSYYNAYDHGSVFYIYEEGANFKIKKYYVLSKHQLKDSYYFVLSNQQGKIFIVKVVYKGCPDIMEVSKTSKNYLNNKDVFDLWVEEEYNKRNDNIYKYYETFSLLNIKVREQYATDVDKGQIGSLELKKEYNGNYYFIVGIEDKELKNKQYVIAKIAWNNGYIHAIKVSAKEYKQNEKIFASWINEIKNKEKA